jgi:hypothetical protein
MTNKPKSRPANAATAMAASDLRTQMVKEQTEKDNAEFTARTEKLRALRLAKEAADRAIIASHPAPVKPKRKRVT